jgi:hypothetical protein
MTTTPSSSNTPGVRPQVLVRELLSRPVVVTPRREMTPARARRVAALERRAPTIIEQARDAGVDIDYLGINPLFAETRLYRGGDTDWLLGPAANPDDAVVPRDERRALERLAKSDLDFPLIYVAHEVDKEKTKHLDPGRDTSHVELGNEQAKNLVGPSPAPRDVLAAGERYADHATEVLRTIGRVAPIVGKAALVVVGAPVVLGVGAIASLATLDPIILGAVPAVTPEPGELAAWFVLARWDW